jgi:tight adherence protein B
MLAGAAALSAVLAVIVAFQAAAALREWRIRRDIVRQLRSGHEISADVRTHAAVLRASAEAEDDLLRIFADRFPRLWDLHHLVAQSGTGWRLSGLLGRSLAGAVLTGVVVLTASGSTPAAAAAMMTGGLLPVFYLRHRKSRRVFQMESQLPDAIDLIARAVRAGHPLSEGLRMAAEEAPDPLASEFRVTFEEQRFGLPFEEALLGLGDRVEVVDVRILITAILVQREVGGNLSEILEQISETMRARFNLRRQVRVYTAQGRMSGYTLAALPVFVGLAVQVINPAYLQTLFVEPLGRALLATAVVMQAIGFFWIRRIVDIRY